VIPPGRAKGRCHDLTKTEITVISDEDFGLISPGPGHERAAGFTNRELKLGHHEKPGIFPYLELHLSTSMLSGFS